ncbi:MAG: hypothetical protein KJ915_05890 [Candidatus Omnitrophica bacterium]|nr:hypothetical protein [Candidatus Omnitrophota bacterium]
MKKVLIIAYHFPPVGGSGAQRIIKFVRYLPEFGWQPLVLSVKEPKRYELRDDTLLREISSTTKVFRTYEFNIFELLYKIKGGAKRGGNIPPYSDKKEDASVSNFKSKPGLLDGIKRLVISFFQTPDDKIGWFPFGFFTGLYVTKKENVDLLFSSSPSVISHLIALGIKLLTGKNWIADFRDPWTSILLQTKVTPFRRNLEIFLERKVIEKTDKVILNTDRTRNDFLTRYPNLDSSKFITITNGFDNNDFPKEIGSQSKDKDIFVISHTGEFHEKLREPLNFLEAISQLINENKIRREEIIVNFVGGGKYLETEDFLIPFNVMQLRDVVKIVEHVSHDKCIEFLRGSDLLLLLQPTIVFKLQVPAKAYEYIYTQKSILSLSPINTATTDLIASLNNGVVADPDSVNDIKKKIFELFLRFKKEGLKIDGGDATTTRFNRRNLTSDLAVTFNQVSGVE